MSSGRDPLLTSKEDSNRGDEPIDPLLRRNSIVSVSQVIVIGRNEGDEFGPEAQQFEKDNIHKAIDKMKKVRYEKAKGKKGLLLIKEDDGDDSVSMFGDSVSDLSIIQIAKSNQS